MKKNYYLIASLCVLFFFPFSQIKGQTLIAAWEAEDFIGTGIFSNAIVISTDESISGGKYLGKQKFSQSNSLFYYVDVPEAGWYNLTAYYMTKVTDNTIEVKDNYVCIGVRVNNQDITGIKIEEADATATETTNPRSKSVSICLNQGINQIRIGQNKAYRTKEKGTADVDGLYLPPLDKFELYRDITKEDAAPSDVVNNPSGNHYEQKAANYLTSDIATFVAEGADYTMMKGLFSIECTSSPDNATVNHLIDNDPTTIFTSNKDEETFIVSYPSEKGIFCLRAIEADNHYVSIGLIERSKDKESWNGGFGRAALFDTAKKTAVSTVGIWGNSDEPTPNTNHKDYIYYRVTIKRIPGSNEPISIPDLRICGSFQNLTDLTGSENGLIEIDVIGSEGKGSFESSSSYLVNAIDNDFGTKCSYINGENGVLMNLTYTFSKYALVDHYSITTAGGVDNKLQREPISWKLEGWNAQEELVLLDEVDGHNWACIKRAQVLRKIETPNIYKYYKLTLTKKASETANGIHIGEFQLLGEIKENLTTKIKNNENSELLNIYSEGDFIVLDSFADKKVNYQIVDITGKLIKQGVFNADQEKLFLEKGVYIVRASVNNLPISSKILVK